MVPEKPGKVLEFFVSTVC